LLKKKKFFYFFEKLLSFASCVDFYFSGITVQVLSIVFATVARGIVIVRRTTAVLRTIVKRPVAAEAATDFVADKIDVFGVAGGGVEVCIEIISVFGN
jgi:hypothetical protein